MQVNRALFTQTHCYFALKTTLFRVSSSEDKLSHHLMLITCQMQPQNHEDWFVFSDHIKSFPSISSTRTILKHCFGVPLVSLSTSSLTKAGFLFIIASWCQALITKMKANILVSTCTKRGIERSFCSGDASLTRQK